MWNLNISQLYRPTQPVKGIALLYKFHLYEVGGGGAGRPLHENSAIHAHFSSFSVQNSIILGLLVYNEDVASNDVISE
jgi:hypothetical protein